jgi:flagellin-like hook-associated protein FlgL
MRVSTSQIYQVPADAMSSASVAASLVNRRIASGKRIDAASQDAGAVTRASQQQQLKSETVVFADNLNALDSQYSQVDQSTGNLSDSLAYLGTLLVQSQNGSFSSNEVSIVGDSIKQEMALIKIELARTDSQGRPLYSAGVADAAHPALQVLPGLMMGTEIPLSAADQTALTAITTADWSTNLGATTSTQRADAMVKVQQLFESVNRARGAVGARWQQVQTYQDINNTAGLAATEAKSNLMDTDIAQSASDLATYQAQLQAARSLFSRISSNTLFDVLR